MIEFRAKVLRKQDDLPRYIVVKAGYLTGQVASFEATVTLNDGPDFPRNIRPWGKGSDAFFFNLTADQARKSGVETGDDVRVRIVPS